MTSKRSELLQALDQIESGRASNGAASNGAAGEFETMMRRNIELLGELKPRSLPENGLPEQILSAIYDRVQQDTSEVGPLMQRALPPKAAPEGLAFETGAWQPTLQELPVELAGALPRRPAPGWLWSRIRSDIRQQIADRRKSWHRWVAAAAVLVVSTSLLVAFVGFGGTSEGPEIVIEHVDQPIGDAFHPVHFLRDLSETR